VYSLLDYEVRLFNNIDILNIFLRLPFGKLVKKSICLFAFFTTCTKNVYTLHILCVTRKIGILIMRGLSVFG
jgi:hypothetical protein